jgi:alpha-tubulin suppressor-like RCC1 family protein
VPAKTAASYNLYVVNNTGHTAIKVNGLTYSGTPTWVTGSTLDPQAVDVAFSLAFDATGATSYANTTALPAGTALLSNGYFYGTVTGIAEETTYNFTVVAIDAENQDSPREFSVTVTVSVAIPTQAFFAGRNNFGWMGTNVTVGSYRSSPVQLGTTTEWTSYSTPAGSFMSIKENGTLWAQGATFSGCLGLNDLISRSSPTQVGSLTNWKSISSGYTNVIAQKADNTLWSWGDNSSGQLGLNDRGVNKSSPVQIGTGTYLNGFAGYQHVFLIGTDNTLWAIGRNTSGQLGLNDRVNRSSPVQVGSNTDWESATGSVENTILKKTDGTLWSIGDNSQGSLGVNQIGTNDRSSPTQIGSDTNWDKITMMYYAAFSIKTDGTLWAWGGADSGVLGLNVGGNKSSPTQVGTGTNWYNLSLPFGNPSGGTTMTATKTDGTMWVWGRNNRGQLGLSNTIDKSSPTQLGTQTYWLTSSANYYGRAFFKQ